MSIKNCNLLECADIGSENRIRVCLRGNYRANGGQIVVPEDRLVEIPESKDTARKIHESGVNLELAFLSGLLQAELLREKEIFILVNPRQFLFAPPRFRPYI